jgi:Holliday junction resolvase RusA-like endonuclease
MRAETTWLDVARETAARTGQRFSAEEEEALCGDGGTKRDARSAGTSGTGGPSRSTIKSSAPAVSATGDSFGIKTGTCTVARGASSSIYTIMLPLPPRSCSSNSGSGRSRHWRTSAAGKREYRNTCWQYFTFWEKTRGSPLGFRRPVKLHWEYQLPRKRVEGYAPRDCMNGSDALKAAQDALVDAGLLPDDDYKHISSSTVTIRREEDIEPGVLLTIEEV